MERGMLQICPIWQDTNNLFTKSAQPKVTRKRYLTITHKCALFYSHGPRAEISDEMCSDSESLAVALSHKIRQKERDFAHGIRRFSTPPVGTVASAVAILGNNLSSVKINRELPTCLKNEEMTARFTPHDSAREAWGHPLLSSCYR